MIAFFQVDDCNITHWETTDVACVFGHALNI